MFKNIKGKGALEDITFANKILGFKGITEVTPGGVLGEVGDLSKFAHCNFLLRHTDLNSAKASSGK